MSSWLVKLLDRIFVVLGALVFSQIPLFLQQYQNQLAGHVAELRMQVQAMQNAAMQSGKSLHEYIQKFVDSHDSDFSRQGEIMSGMVARFQQLSDGLTALEDAAIWSRPFEYMWHFNYDISTAALKTFSLGIPLTFEGLVYALVGIIVGYMTFAGICRLCRCLSFGKNGQKNGQKMDKIHGQLNGQ